MLKKIICLCVILIANTNQITALPIINSNAKQQCICDLGYNNIDITVLGVEKSSDYLITEDEYVESVIITMKIKNNSTYDIELSNYDIASYQNGKLVKDFVSTYDGINGLIGNIRSQESKEIKMGVSLHTQEDPIKIELINIDDTCDKKMIKIIEI